MSGHFDDDALPPFFEQAQCWICPHCFDDAHHFSDQQGCEQQGRPEHEHRITIGPTDV